MATARAALLLAGVLLLLLLGVGVGGEVRESVHQAQGARHVGGRVPERRTRAATALHRREGTDMEVFGYIPHWVAESVYAEALHWDVLSDVAMFGVRIDGDGSMVYPGSHVPPRWLIDYAHAHGVRVHVTAIIFHKHRELLQNRAHVSNAVFTLLAIADELGVDGINLDIEAAPSDVKPDIDAFVLELQWIFATYQPDVRISVAAAGSDWSHQWDKETLGPALDRIFVMAYDEFWAGSHTVGPVASLDFSRSSLQLWMDASVNSTEKLILGVPYYGYEWETETINATSPTLGRGKDHTYDAMASLAALSDSGERWDDASSTPYYYTTDADGTIRQGWYENRASLALKYALAERMGVAGVGMWALGYDTTATLKEELAPYVDTACAVRAGSGVCAGEEWTTVAKWSADALSSAAGAMVDARAEALAGVSPWCAAYYARVACAYQFQACTPREGRVSAVVPVCASACTAFAETCGVSAAALCSDVLFGDADHACFSIDAPPRRAPSAVSAVRVSAETDTRVCVAWDAPEDDGGAEVTAFRVALATHEGDAVGAVQQLAVPPACVDVPAHVTTRHFVANVTARNAMGWGERASVAVEAPPVAPRAPRVTVHETGVETLELQLVPAWDGGAAVESVHVQFVRVGACGDEAAVRTLAGTPPWVTLDGLASNTRYDVRVSLRNAVGMGEAWRGTLLTDIDRDDMGVDAVHVRPVGGDGTMFVTWEDAPAYSFDAHEVCASGAGGSAARTCTHTTRDYAVLHLEPDATYSVSVRGDESPVLHTTAITTPLRPVAVSGVVVDAAMGVHRVAWDGTRVAANRAHMYEVTVVGGCDAGAEQAPLYTARTPTEHVLLPLAALAADGALQVRVVSVVDGAASEPVEVCVSAEALRSSGGMAMADESHGPSSLAVGMAVVAMLLLGGALVVAVTAVLRRGRHHDAMQPQPLA